MTETVLFPLGPVDAPGAPPYGVMISVPGAAVETSRLLSSKSNNRERHLIFLR